MKTDSCNSTGIPVWTNNVEILAQEVSICQCICIEKDLILILSLLRYFYLVPFMHHKFYSLCLDMQYFHFQIFIQMTHIKFVVIRKNTHHWWQAKRSGFNLLYYLYELLNKKLLSF